MRKVFVSVLLMISACFSAQNIILKNVNIIPVNHDITIPGCNIFIRDGIIEKITPYPYVKEPGRRAKKKDSTVGYVTYDCNGGYVIPGLADMHAHLPGKEDPIKMQEYLKLCLAAGVTEVRSMRGERSHLAMRDSVKKNLKKNAPELYVSYVLPEKDSVLTTADAERIVNAAKNEGYDFLKYLGGLNRNSIRELVLASSGKLPIAGHAWEGNLTESYKLGFASVEHYQPVLKEFRKGTVAFNSTLDTLKNRRTAICPTLSFYHIYSFTQSTEELQKRNGMQFVNEKVKKAWLKTYTEDLSATKEQWKIDFENKYVNASKKTLSDFNEALRDMANSSVCLLLSPDECIFNVPGFSMYEEMLLYKKAGLSNHQILKCATLNAAKCLGESSWGSVEVGKRANLVILRGNPLEKIENVKEIDAVILHGKYWKPEDLLK